MPPPARPMPHDPAAQAAAQAAAQKPQDGPLAAVESLPAQIARPVIRSVVLALGQVFRLDPAEMKGLLEKIAD